ncbi:MAG: RNA polymerase subunit sigma-70 [Chloroflexi bacterium]|nr:MAG: RNA polymerase subunit sigma-70 [Chloroflexota bacterium]
MARLRSGDDAALGELYDRYSGPAFALALRMLGERGVAEDVVQEAFLSVWRRASTFDTERGSVRAWLLSIVRNAAIDRTRGRNRQRQGDVALDDVAYRLAADDVWSEVAQRLERERVRAALRELPSEQRETLELAYFGGMTQAEIAARTGEPLGTVKSRARLGLRRLERLLRAGYENGPDGSLA